MNNNIIIDEKKQELDSLRQLASIALKSGNYPGMTEHNLLNIMLSAKDLGVSPFKAINGAFYIVNGKLCMSTALMADRIRKEGHSIKITEWTKEKCVMIGVRKDNGDSVKLEFTMEDAQLAGLLASPTWKKYPKAMLYNRAMSMLARVLFPDVVGNCYSEDEAEEIKGPQKKAVAYATDEGETIEVKSVITLADLGQVLMDDMVIPDADKHLIKYMEHCQPLAQQSGKSMEDIVEEWLKEPERFLTYYKKWVAKKNVEAISPSLVES
jgi:hypothetical protein